jgi:hypothetical protein
MYRMMKRSLLSYARLIQYSSDLDIAQSAGLINKCITWQRWQDFRNELLHHLAGRNMHSSTESFALVGSTRYTA